MIYKFEHFLLEHGFARVMRILWGDVPNVRQIGILTANNPNYQQLSQKENDERNRRLMAQLRASNYGPIKIKGKFTGATTGKEEDSFLVPHISREATLSFGRHFGQGDVIWGQKKADDEDNPYFAFEWINCETGLTTQHRYVAISGGGIPGRANAYSKAKARKFVIPFWDDPYKDYLPGSKRGAVEQPGHIAALRPVLVTETWTSGNPAYDLCFKPQGPRRSSRMSCWRSSGLSQAGVTCCYRRNWPARLMSRLSSKKSGQKRISFTIRASQASDIGSPVAPSEWQSRAFRRFCVTGRIESGLFPCCLRICFANSGGSGEAGTGAEVALPELLERCFRIGNWETILDSLPVWFHPPRCPLPQHAPFALWDFSRRSKRRASPHYLAAAWLLTDNGWRVG